jgi:hypothetical protein
MTRPKSDYIRIVCRLESGPEFVDNRLHEYEARRVYREQVDSKLWSLVELIAKDGTVIEMWER